MANTEKINVAPAKEVIDAAVQAAEAIPVKPDSKLGVIGGVVFVGGLIITAVALGVRHHKNKKQAKEAAAANVVEAEDANDDSSEADSTEK